MNKFLILLIGIFMISSVYALGVSPARTTINFKPGLTKTVNFNIINSEGKDLKIAFSTQGDLAKYISLSTKEGTLSASEKSKAFSYTLKLPDNLKPGLHKGNIFAMQLPGGNVSGGSQILATLAVVIQVYIYVPYPGKYATAQMYVYDADKGGNVRFVIPVVNAGKFDLTSVHANIDIYNDLGKKITSFNTKSIAIKSGARKELVYNWKADVPIGEYKASAILVYDDGTLNLEKTFSIGSKNLVLQSINVNDFSLGQIAKLQMLVENKWSKPIENAYIKTDIKDSQGDIVSSFKSASYNIKPLSKQNFVSYWDTAGVKAGTYDTEISINYAGKISKKDLQFKVEQNKLTVIGLGYVVSTDEGNAGGTSTIVMVLIIVIVLLVLINLLWFFLLRKRLKK